MNALADLQRAMQARVLRNDASALADIADARGVDATQRLGVYTHAYRARLAGVLRDHYAGLRALAGDGEFHAMVLACIDATPSTHPNVRWYGASLPAFVRTTAPWSARAELADMAALDWALGLAFDAADELPLDVATLAAIKPPAWPDLRLRLHASLQSARLGHNVDRLRRALDRGEPLPALERLDPARAWVAWRHDGGVRHRRLDHDEAAALDAVALGARFAELCERLCEWHAPQAVAARAASLLRTWVDAGWVAAP